MIRLLLKVALPLVAVFTGFGLAARAVGWRQPPNAMLRGFIDGCAGKPQPCWYGIQPGETTIGVAHQQLSGYRYAWVGSSSWNASHLQRYQTESGGCGLMIEIVGTGIQAVNLSECPNLRVGDLLAMLGVPDSVCLYYTRFGLMYGGDGETLIMLPGDGLFSPYTPVESIRLTAYPLPWSSMRWHQFIPFQRYRDLYPPPDGTICR
jgi:hypothetical protein